MEPVFDNVHQAAAHIDQFCQNSLSVTTDRQTRTYLKKLQKASRRCHSESHNVSELTNQQIKQQDVVFTNEYLVWFRSLSFNDETITDDIMEYMESFQDFCKSYLRERKRYKSEKAVYKSHKDWKELVDDYIDFARQTKIKREYVLEHWYSWVIKLFI